MNANVKIFPSLMAVAVVALGIKLTSIMADYDLLSQPVVAQENQDDKKPEDNNNPPADKKDEKKKEDDVPADLAELLKQDDLSTAEEEETLKLLRQRSRELDAREKRLNLMENMLVALDKQMKDDIQTLEKIKAEIKIQLGQFDEREKVKMDKLVSYYNKMKPKEAALVFSQLIKDRNQERVLLRVIEDMKEANVAKILAQMPPREASQITMKLAEIAKPNVDNVIGR